MSAVAWVLVGVIGTVASLLLALIVGAVIAGDPGYGTTVNKVPAKTPRRPGAPDAVRVENGQLLEVWL